VITAAIRLRYDYDPTTTRLRRIARACFHSTRFDVMLYFLFLWLYVTLIGDNSECDFACCVTRYRIVDCPLYVYMSSVTLVHPANAVGQNGIPFSRDTPVVPSNTVLLVPFRMGREDLGVKPTVHSDVTYHKLLRPSFFSSLGCH